MPRLPGGPATDLPACPRPGHEARRVVRDGRYGTPPRQRFRCVGPDGFHRFVPDAPEPLARRGPVPAVPDHAMRAVARPPTCPHVRGRATREPGHRALPRVAATLRDCPTRLPAAQDTYHAAIA